MRNLPLGLGLVVIAFVGACSLTNGTPLGGPYGGTTSNDPTATQGSSSGSDDGGSPASAGDDSGAGDDAGAEGVCFPYDAGPATASNAGGTVPTWSSLYTKYFVAGTIGNCSDSVCHTEMPNASTMYTWLQSENNDYCGCPNCLASIASNNGSVLTWLGGSMPTAGPTTETQATADLQAWFAAGAKNN